MSCWRHSLLFLLSASWLAHFLSELSKNQIIYQNLSSHSRYNLNTWWFWEFLWKIALISFSLPGRMEHSQKFSQGFLYQMVLASFCSTKEPFWLSKMSLGHPEICIFSVWTFICPLAWLERVDPLDFLTFFLHLRIISLFFFWNWVA